MVNVVFELLRRARANVPSWRARRVTRHKQQTQKLCPDQTKTKIVVNYLLKKKLNKIKFGLWCEGVCVVSERDVCLFVVLKRLGVSVSLLLHYLDRYKGERKG